jgi:geranylgeranyl diphosphate synthase type II
MNQSVAELQQEVESALTELAFPQNPVRLYEPIRYMLGLGGKRMRPVLVLMAGSMFGRKSTDLMPAALAVEVFHNFTLLHDDIMDKAPLRRGNPTVHERWSSDIAILSGDAMFVKSVQLLMACKGENHTVAMDMFLQTALEVCEGQQYDMDFQSEDEVSIDRYLDMIRLKTAVLLGGSLAIGATLSGASPDAVKHLYDFGVNLGIAFQLQDDILDVYADQAKFGKQAGGDILANKKTFLLLTALSSAHGHEATSLNHWLRLEEGSYDSGEKVQAVTQLYNALGVREQALTKMEQLYSRALQDLNAVEIPAEKKVALRELADFLMARES